MKPSKIFTLVSLLIIPWMSTLAQNVSTRTNEFEVDFSDPKKVYNTTIPVINWITPVAESNYSGENKYKIKVEIESSKPIKNITIEIKEDETAGSRGTLTITPEPHEKNKTTVEKGLTLMDGNNVVEIVAENMDGTKTISRRTIRVGSASLADASKLDRTDYALIFATDEYDHWSGLVNPVFDSRTIAKELKDRYGYKVDVVENATQETVVKKLREYAEKKYKPLDQLFIFFAGHGQYDQTFGEGYVVTKDSKANDEAKTSYLSHNRLRSIVNNIPSEHIFLCMDVCFGGTFDQTLASSRGEGADEVYKEASQAEIVSRKLTYKTRRYLTSGGKTYVSDGIKGSHSPFARKILEALRSSGGKDQVLTMSELLSYVEGLKIAPRSGEFGDNAPGSDFVFVLKR
jgi:hypothetical protein